MSEEKSVPGFWRHSCCAYSDSRLRVPVLAAEPNGDSSRKGYLRYLILKHNEVRLQVGPILPSSELHKVKSYPVPNEVAEAAIQAAMAVVNAWYRGPWFCS